MQPAVLSATARDSTADREAADAIAAFASTAIGDSSRPALRERAIAGWLPMAQRLARRYVGRGEPAQDLTQVAVVGLIKAVDRYQADRGVDFPVFAIPTILGELKRYFRDHGWAVRISRRLQERWLDVTAANSQLSHALGRRATVADIAAHLKVSEEDVLEALEGARAYTATSLSTPVNDDSGLTLADTIGGEDYGFELTELRAALGPALAALGERERRIIALRFYGNHTQSEIAERTGISQMHVSRVLSKALAKLHKDLFGETAQPPYPTRPRRPADTSL